jgi:hypothetical protein
VSVIVIARFTVPNLDKAIATLADFSDLLDEVTEDAKKIGAIHHQFMARDGELVVLDEWASAEEFGAFFDGNTKVMQITAAAGVAGPPAVEVYDTVKAAGTF